MIVKNSDVAVWERFISPNAPMDNFKSELLSKFSNEAQIPRKYCVVFEPSGKSWPNLNIPTLHGFWTPAQRLMDCRIL